MRSQFEQKALNGSDGTIQVFGPLSDVGRDSVVDFFVTVVDVTGAVATGRSQVRLGSSSWDARLTPRDRKLAMGPALGSAVSVVNDPDDDFTTSTFQWSQVIELVAPF